MEIFFIFLMAPLSAGDCPKKIEMEMVKLIQPYEEKHSEDVETDVFTYVYGDLPKILEDEITLPNHDTLTKLSSFPWHCTIGQTRDF